MLRYALHEGVAGVSGLARARHCVTDDRALSVDTTRARTRVDTLAVDTGLCGRAVRVDNTLGATVGRGTHVPGQARTGGVAAVGLAL